MIFHPAIGSGHSPGKMQVDVAREATYQATYAIQQERRTPFLQALMQ